MKHLDTLQIYLDLKNAGMNEEQAKVISNSLNDLFHKVIEHKKLTSLFNVEESKAIENLKEQLENIISNKK